MPDEITNLFNIFEASEGVTGLFERKDIVKKIHNECKDTAEQVFIWVLNPDYTFNISTRIKSKGRSKQISTYEQFKMIANSLNDRVITGNVAAKAVNDFLDGCDQLHAKWYTRILKKDLRTGIGSTLIIEMFPHVKKTDRLQIKEAAGYPLDDKYYTRSLTWIVQPKIDGTRMFLCFSNGTLEVSSRGNKSYPKLAELFLNDAKQIYDYTMEDFVLDTELYSSNWNDSMTVIGSAKSEVSKEVIDNTILYALDYIPYNEFKLAKSSKLQDERLKDMVQMIDDINSLNPPLTFVKKLPDVIDLPTGTPYSSVQKYIDEYANKGYEGIMLREAKHTYQFKRHWCWLKGKKFFTVDCKVIGVNKEGKRPGEIRCLEVLAPDGKEFDVSSGLKQNQKKDFFNNPELILGKTVEVQFQKESENSKVIVSILRIRDDKNL